MLSRLCASSSAIHDKSIQAMSRTTTKFCLFLNRVRQHVVSLHAALSQGWKSGCHPQHKICFYLDGHEAPLRQQKSSIEFRLALPDPMSVLTHNALQETQVEVMESDVLQTSASLRYIY